MLTIQFHFLWAKINSSSQIFGFDLDTNWTSNGIEFTFDLAQFTFELFLLQLKSFKTNLCVLMPECEHKSLWKCPSLSIGPPIKSSAHELNDRRLMRGKRLVDALAPSPEGIHKQRSQKLELFRRIFFVANSQLVLS